MTAPHHDCPTCPACSSPCGTRDGEAIPAGHIRCAACGLDWLAMPGETAQALAADRAWGECSIVEDPDLERMRKVDEIAAEHARRQFPLFGAPALTPDNPT